MEKYGKASAFIAANAKSYLYINPIIDGIDILMNDTGVAF